MIESTLGKDSSVPLIRHDPSDLASLILVKQRKIHYRIQKSGFWFSQRNVPLENR